MLNFIESNLKFSKHKFISQSSCKLSFSLIKVPLRKISALTLFTGTRAVTAKLLVMVKHTTTFLLELQSTRVFSNLTERPLRSVKESVSSDHLLECSCSVDLVFYLVF